MMFTDHKIAVTFPYWYLLLQSQGIYRTSSCLSQVMNGGVTEARERHWESLCICKHNFIYTH